MEEISISKYVDIALIEGDKSIIYQRKTKKTYVLGMHETKVLQMLKEAHSFNEFTDKCTQYTTNEIRFMLDKFDKYGFLSNSRVVSAKKQVLKLQISLFSPNKLLKSNSTFVKMLTWGLKYLTLPLLIIGLYILWKNALEFSNIITGNWSGWKQIFYMAIMLLIIVIFHEFGHAVAARSQKISVPEYGFMLYFFIPLFYTKICGSSLIKKKFDRIFILLAGVAMNALLFGLSEIVYLYVNGMAKIWLGEFAIGNFAMIFINLLLFIKLDGYYILCDLLNEPKLREKSMAQIITLVQFIHKKGYKDKIRHLADADSSDIEKVMNYVFGGLSVLFLPIALTLSGFSLISFILNHTR